MLTEIVCRDKVSLDSLIDLAIHHNDWLCKWVVQHSINYAFTLVNLITSSVSVESGEKYRRRQQEDQEVVEMPHPHVISPFSLTICCFSIQVQIRHSEFFFFTLPSLIDSGAAGNFADQETLAKLQYLVSQLQ